MLQCTANAAISSKRFKSLNLLNALISNNAESLITNCSKLYNSGNEPIAILEGLLNITRDLLLKFGTEEYSSLFYTSKDFYPELNNLSNQINKERIINWHNKLKNTEYQIKTSSQPRLWLEINLSSLLETNKEIKENDDLDKNKEIKENDDLDKNK